MRFLGVFSMFRSKRRAPEAVESEELAQRISARADAVNKQLENYCRSKDPFAAMMADLYNRDQMSRIYRGMFK